MWSWVAAIGVWRAQASHPHVWGCLTCGASPEVEVRCICLDACRQRVDNTFGMKVSQFTSAVAHCSKCPEVGSRRRRMCLGSFRAVHCGHHGGRACLSRCNRRVLQRVHVPSNWIENVRFSATLSRRGRKRGDVPNDGLELLYAFVFRERLCSR